MSVHSQPLSCCPAMIYVLGRRERECKLLMRGDSEGRLAIWIIPDVHDKKMKLVRQESFEKLPGKNDWSYLFMQIIFTVHNVVAERLCFHRRVCHSVHGAGGVYPSMHWGRHPPPPDGHCSGRYASYWNAFLFKTLLYQRLHFVFIKFGCSDSTDNGYDNDRSMAECSAHTWRSYWSSGR